MENNTKYRDNPLSDHRQLIDRRRQNINTIFYSLYKGRRSQARRDRDSAQDFYTDIYERWVGMIVISISCLSAVDAFFTLKILDRGGIEVNPVMASLLEIDTTTFVIGKIMITSVCLLFALVHINFNVLKIIPMRYSLATIFVLYVCLMGYELFLLSI